GYVAIALKQVRAEGELTVRASREEAPFLLQRPVEQERADRVPPEVPVGERRHRVLRGRRQHGPNRVDVTRLPGRHVPPYQVALARLAQRAQCLLLTRYVAHDSPCSLQ